MKSQFCQLMTKMWLQIYGEGKISILRKKYDLGVQNDSNYLYHPFEKKFLGNLGQVKWMKRNKTYFLELDIGSHYWYNQSRESSFN